MSFQDKCIVDKRAAIDAATAMIKELELEAKSLNSGAQDKVKESFEAAVKGKISTVCVLMYEMHLHMKLPNPSCCRST